MSAIDNHLNNTTHLFALYRCTLSQIEVFKVAERMVYWIVRWYHDEKTLVSLLESLKARYNCDCTASWIFATDFVLMCDTQHKGISSGVMHAFYECVADYGLTAQIVTHFDTNGSNYYKDRWNSFGEKLGEKRIDSNAAPLPPPQLLVYTTPATKLYRHLVRYTVLHSEDVSEDAIMYTALNDGLNCLNDEERREVEADVHNMQAACRERRVNKGKILFNGTYCENVDTINLIKNNQFNYGR